MTKKSKQSNPNRARSKNNPGGKRNDPKIDWSSYNKGRSAEGQTYIQRMNEIADIVREILGIAPGMHNRRVSAILVSLLKGEEKLSYWGLIKHFDKHPGDLKLCELSRKYSRSWYQLRISEIDPEILKKIITRMAGENAVHDTLAADSSGFSVSRYQDWQNAKYGDLSVREFVKLNIVSTIQGMICAAIVTPGHASDSPYLRQMIPTLPEGDGYVLADAAYDGVENCNAVRDSGRRAIIDPKSNAVIKGFNARAEMLRFHKDHPGTFYKLLRLRNNVESVFSSIKARFGGVVRAVKEKTQSIELLSVAICYNMTFV